MVRNGLGCALVVVLLAALACLGWFSYRAYDAYSVAGPTQQARDDSTSAAEQAMLNVTTIDPKDMAGFNTRLESSFAGDALNQVRQQIVATLDPMLKNAGGNAGSTTSRVVRSAPTEVDADGGSAQVLVYLAVSGKTAGQASETPSTMGFLVGMSKIDDTWKATKVTALDGVAVSENTTAAPGSPAPTSTPAGGN